MRLVVTTQMTQMRLTQHDEPHLFVPSGRWWVGFQNLRNPENEYCDQLVVRPVEGGHDVLVCDRVRNSDIHKQKGDTHV